MAAYVLWRRMNGYKEEWEMVINIDGVRIDLCKVDLYTIGECRDLPCVALCFPGRTEVFTCATEEEAEQLIRFLDNCTDVVTYTGRANFLRN